MTIDKLIGILTDDIREAQVFYSSMCDNPRNHKLFLIEEIALATLKADKMSLRMCEDIFQYGYRPRETELDEILNTLGKD